MTGDPRCEDALDHLEARRRPDGGWSADARYWRISERGSNTEAVSWGKVSARAMNEWVTCDALAVLSVAGRPLRQPVAHMAIAGRKGQMLWGDAGICQWDSSMVACRHSS